jgi:hypothetical protein
MSSKQADAKTAQNYRAKPEWPEWPECRNCQHCQELDAEGYCPILAATMIYDAKDAEYPKEWKIGGDTQPECTAFKEKESLEP